MSEIPTGWLFYFSKTREVQRFLYNLSPRRTADKRCAAFMRKMEEVYNEMAEIQQNDTEDMEYTKAVVDRKLQAILGDQFEPWERRYCYYDG